MAKPNYALGGKGYWDDADGTHRRRYEESVDWVKEALGLLPPGDRQRRILELGGHGPWTEMMKAAASVYFHKTEGVDLRTDPYVSADLVGEFDIVVSMELMEHLHEDPKNHGADPWPDGVEATGAVHMLEECFRVLRPGGILFLTTPNAASLRILLQVVNGRYGMFYRQHYREYDVPEVLEMVNRVGFGLLKVATSNVWRNGGMPPEHARTCLEALAMVPGWNPAHRGEDIFLLAQKPLKEQPAS